jgi:hypothetical protein
MWQGGSPDPSRCATRASLGILASEDRVSAKTEQPKNEEHDNHCADDIDDSIHDPFSCVCKGHISYKNIFARAAGSALGYCPPHGILQCKLAISRTPHQFLMPLDHIQGRDVDPTQLNEAP